ncbi:MAG: methylated-DNA--[protein]-cysteine S-methyltransferase [Chloroflexi bacterium]|nr:methylated-DNA--[protein]-cysteine S-methyltransferase [Chloroflexota bacterium]
MSEDIRAATIAAPWGPLELAASERGMVALEVMAPREMFDARTAARLGMSVVRGSGDGPAARTLDAAIAAVEAFFEGRPDEVRALPLDLGVAKAWDRAVFEAVREVPYGRVTSYGRIAMAIGRRGAARAVGGAVGRNPIGLAIPCHRVIAGDGSIGGYGGDWSGTREELLSIKRRLLELEGISIPATFPEA